MDSRMSRYSEEKNRTNTRSSLNQDLYKTIYENSEYSNVEGILTNPKPNEVNLNKLRELLQERENSSAPKPIIKKRPEINLNDTSSFDDDNRNYDIREILSKAKNDHKDDKYRSMQDFDYTLPDTIKSGTDLPKEADEIGELMNSITNSTSLQKLSNEELSLNLFDDLKSDTMISDSKSIRKIINEEIKKELNDTNTLNNNGIDKSFFTNSLNLKKDDFDEIGEMSETIHKNNKLLTTILLFIATAVVIILIVIIVAQVIN